MRVRRPTGESLLFGMQPGRRMVLAVVVVTVILAGVAGILIMRSDARQRAAVLSDTEKDAQFAAIEVYAHRLGIVRTLQAVAGEPALRSGNAADIRETLAAVEVAPLGLTGGMAWSDRDGAVLVATDGATGGRAGAAWRTDALNDQGWTVTGATTSEHFQGEVMIFAVATEGADGRANGVLAAGWSLGFVRAVADRRNAGVGESLQRSTPPECSPPPSAPSSTVGTDPCGTAPPAIRRPFFAVRTAPSTLSTPPGGPLSACRPVPTAKRPPRAPGRLWCSTPMA